MKKMAYFSSYFMFEKLNNLRFESIQCTLEPFVETYGGTIFHKSRPLI